MSTNLSIGVFDSGVGGLTVAREIKTLLPDARLVYIADSAFTPYGDKSAGQIIERCHYLAQQLDRLGVNAIVVACNTATALAVDSLRQSQTLPIIAMEPAVKPAVQYSTQQRVGILATTQTLSSQRYARLLERYAEGAEVIEQPCPGLVEQVEKLETDSSQTRQLLRDYLEPLLARQVDTLVLGCTHYPLLRDQITAITGDQVHILDTGQAVAREVARRLNLQPSDAAQSQSAQLSEPLSEPLSAPHRFLTTGDVQHFQRQLNHYWPEAVRAEPLTQLNQLTQ